MFGLSFGKNAFIGVDVGTSAIKVVEIKNNSGKPVLTNYAWMTFDGYVKKDGQSEMFETVLPDRLKMLMKESGIKSTDAHISIPAFGGLITLIEFPWMEEKEIEQAIRFEAHKYIPTSLDEVVLSWDILNGGSQSKPAGETQMPKEKIQVLLVAASKSKVEKYEKMAHAAGIKINSIEIESFSMARALVGNDQGNFIIADIGSRVCNILLVEKGVVKINRNIDAGGKDITQTIAKSMAVSLQKAEKIKMSGKDFFATDSYIKFPTIDLIRDEIDRMANAFNSDGSRLKIDSIILSGGTAYLTGLTQYFSQTLKMNTAIGNPFGRVGYDKKIEPLVGRLGTKFSVAVGLALKGMETSK